MCGEGAMTDGVCQKWFAKFRAGDSSLDSTPRSGRAAEVDSDPIETFSENHQCSPLQERTTILQIPKSVMELVKMKNVSFILPKKIKQTLANPIVIL